MTPTLAGDFLEVFTRLQQEIFDNAESHGFHQPINSALFVPAMLGLVGTEVSEAIQAHRKDKKEHFAEELADIVIRVMDLAECQNIDLATEILNKHQANKGRPFKHGNNQY